MKRNAKNRQGLGLLELTASLAVALVLMGALLAVCGSLWRTQRGLYDEIEIYENYSLVETLLEQEFSSGASLYGLCPLGATSQEATQSFSGAVEAIYYKKPDPLAEKAERYQYHALYVRPRAGTVFIHNQLPGPFPPSGSLLGYTAAYGLQALEIRLNALGQSELYATFTSGKRHQTYRLPLPPIQP